MQYYHEYNIQSVIISILAWIAHLYIQLYPKEKLTNITFIKFIDSSKIVKLKIQYLFGNSEHTRLKKMFIVFHCKVLI